MIVRGRKKNRNVAEEKTISRCLQGVGILRLLVLAGPSRLFCCCPQKCLRLLRLLLLLLGLEIRFGVVRFEVGLVRVCSLVGRFYLFV